MMIDASPSSSSSSSFSQWDVLVIGAGPAGGLAALLAAQAGRRVLLVDRRPFPRYKVCGACVNDRALEVLRGAGLGDMVARLPSIALSQVNFHSGGRSLCLPLAGGISVARDRLDAALVEEAIRAGVEFQSETTAVVLPDSPGDRTRKVELTRRDALGVTASSRVVVAADGLGHSSLQQLSEFQSQIVPGSRIGIGATVEGSPERYQFGAVYLAVQRAGYVGVVRTQDAALNVAAALDSGFVRSCGGPAHAAATVLQSAGLPTIERLNAVDWHGTLPLTRRPRNVAGRRIFLLGDSTGYVEPFTGEGIAWAYAAASAAAPLITQAVQDWRPELVETWTRTCREVIGRRQRWCRLLSGLIRAPWAVASVMTVLSRFPALARPLVERINGASSLAKARC